jgi:hypothetical protein
MFGGILNKGNSFALSEPELAGWMREGMTHENLSRRMTKGMPASSNISFDISYVIDPKYILPEPFVNVFIEFLYEQSRSSMYTVFSVFLKISKYPLTKLISFPACPSSASVTLSSP